MNEGYFQRITGHPEISSRDVRLIRRCCRTARRIIDIGCGAGGFVGMSQERLGDTIGIDPSPASARICRGKRLTALVADGTALPFASGTFDVVRAKEIIEHILDLRPFMREIHRVLRPGGLFLAHVPTHFSAMYPIGNFWDDYTHVRPLSRPGVRRLLEDSNFEMLSIRGFTAGRNGIERAPARVVSRVFPYTWVALARKPS